jgi:hypothetical protein
MSKELLHTKEGMPYYPVGTITSYGSSRYLILGYVKYVKAASVEDLARQAKTLEGVLTVPTKDKCTPLFGALETPTHINRYCVNPHEGWWVDNKPVGRDVTRYADAIFRTLIKE